MSIIPNFSVSGYLEMVSNNVSGSNAGSGNHTVTFRCRDSDIESASSEVTRTFTVLPSPFEVITENLTHVKAAHIQTLRTAVNTVRNYHYLTPISWNEEIIVGKTTIKNWPFHILEIRKAIEPVITMINV